MPSPMCWATSSVSVVRLVAEGDVDLERVVDLRHRVDGELDVDDRADDPGDPADAAARSRSVALRSMVAVISLTLRQSWPALASASALTPPTISLISWVIPAWRAWLAIRVYFLMSSSALSVADFIARCRAASSEAAAWSSAK